MKSPRIAKTQKTAPAWKVNDAPKLSQRSPAKVLATSIAHPAARLKNP
jgi:hypothetical protein